MLNAYIPTEIMGASASNIKVVATYDVVNNIFTTRGRTPFCL